VTKKKAVSIVRKVLKKRFDILVTDKVLAESLFPGDYNGWTSGALATVTCESGVPSPMYDAMVLWDGVYEDLASHGLFAEPVNAAVVGIYEA
jgi:hypothetical protein